MRWLAAALMTVLVIGGAGLAFANHDPDIAHLCMKNSSVRLVDDASDCKSNETSLALATEQALATLQGSNASLQTQIDALDALVRRLHGNTAAVIERGLSGESPGDAGHYVITITSCETGEVNCLTLETGPVTDLEEGSVITFDSSTAADFGAIAARLTNGVDDFLRIETDYFDGDGNFAGGGAGSGPESGRFFRTTQVSTGPGLVDLEGLEIGSIDLTIDFVSLFFDGTTTSHAIEYRIFFSLAD